VNTIPLIATAILLALPTAVTAQDWTPTQERRLSSTYNQCTKAAAGKVPESIQCDIAEYDMQDATLNQAYRVLMTRLPEARRAALRTSQRHWIRVRDTTCQRAYNDAGGGQVSDLEQQSCLLRQTIARTMWLERYR
jgi:uncharacterized protein YecT (DUF1311 family)